MKKRKRGFVPPCHSLQDHFECGRVERNKIAFILREFDPWERKLECHLLSRATLAMRASGCSLSSRPTSYSEPTTGFFPVLVTGAKVPSPHAALGLPPFSTCHASSELVL